MKDQGPIRINGLATDKGKLLSNYKSEWNVAISKIIDKVSREWEVSINSIDHEDCNEEEKVSSTENLNKISLIEIENSTKGFNALMFFTKLHFLDCIFTNSFYPKKANRNSEFSAFIYPYEWELDSEDLEGTKYINIHERSNNNRSENDDIKTIERANLYNKIHRIRINTYYECNSK